MVHKARPKPAPHSSGPKGKNVMGPGKGQAPSTKGPKKGGVKTTGKHEYRSNI
jgi:hypothetical protein